MSIYAHDLSAISRKLSEVQGQLLSLSQEISHTYGEKHPLSRSVANTAFNLHGQGAYLRELAESARLIDHSELPQLQREIRAAIRAGLLTESVESIQTVYEGYRAAGQWFSAAVVAEYLEEVKNESGK